MEDDSKQTNAGILGGCRTSFSPWQQQSMWDTSCSCRHPLFQLRQHLLLLDPQDLHQPSYFSWICYTVWFVWIHNIYKVGSGPRALFYLILYSHHCLVRHTKVCGLKLVCELMKEFLFCTLLQMCDLVKSISYCQESHTLRWIWLKLLIGYLLISFCRLLDQRKLPGSEEYVCCATTEQVFVNTASISSSLSPGSNLQTVSYDKVAEFNLSLMTRWLRRSDRW